MALDVDTTFESGIWLRHLPGGGEVLYKAPDPPDNRWQRGTVIDALYFAGDEETMWAEWYRHLAAAAVPPNQQLPRDMWRWEISLTKLADLRTEEQLARVGLAMPKPDFSDYHDFQVVGEALWHEGYQGLLGPSAAKVGGQVLCVFREDVHVPGIEPVPPPDEVTETPIVPTGLRT